MVFRSIKRKWAAVGVLILCIITLSVWAHQRNRIWESDVTFWTDSVKKSPQKARPYQNLAYSLQLRQDFKDALFYYRKSLVFKPHPVVYFNMGMCLDGIGYYCDAVDAYADALKMGYNTSQVHARLAGALAHIGEFAAAVSHFEQAAAMNPEDASLNKKLQALQAFLEKCREPEQCALVSIAQEPGNPALRFKLAMIYERQGKPDQAYDLYERILNEIGHPDRKLYLLVLHRMAVFHAAKGEVKESLRLMRQGVATFPENPYFYYEIAAYYGFLGEIRQSVSWLDLAIKKGYQNWEQIKSDRRLESVRNTQYVQNLLKTRGLGHP